MRVSQRPLFATISAACNRTPSRRELPPGRSSLFPAGSFIDEPLPPTRLRQAAFTGGRKPPLSSTRNPSVDQVAQNTRHNDEAIRPAPSRKGLQYAQGGAGSQKDSLTFEQHHRVEIRGAKPMPAECLLSPGRLQRRKMETPFLISLQNPLHKPVT